MREPTSLEWHEPRSARILVVEDEPHALEAMMAILADAGYEIQGAPTGAEALEIIAEQVPDLIISDVRMPNTDGFELVARLREAAPSRTVPVILVSAMDNPERRVRGLDLGADDFLPKPVDVDELLARVRLHLRHAVRERRLRRETRRDELTGVLNRRGIIETLRLELAHHARSGAPLAVMLIDIDDFKSINDERGHAAGDLTLQSLASALGDVLRATDVVGRIGGDEFLAVMPSADATVADAMRQRLAGIPVRASIGIATAPPHEGVEAIMDAADRDMYERKRSKRR